MIKHKSPGMKRVFEFVIKYKWRYLSGFIILSVLSVVQLLIPNITGQVIDYLNEGEIVEGELLRYILILLSAAISVLGLHYLSRQIIMRAANVYAHVERSNMFHKMVDLSMQFFQRRSVGEMMALATNDVEAIRHMLGRGVTMFINIIVLMIASVIVIGKTINFTMALLLLAPMPIMLVLMSKFGLVINKRFKRVQESFEDMTRKVQENITGMRVVKSFVQESEECDNFKVLNKENYDANVSLIRIQAVFGPLIRFIMDFSQFLVLFIGGSFVIDGTITLGGFIALNSYVGIIMRPIRMIGNFITVMQRGRASLSRISKVLEERPLIFDGKFDEKMIKAVEVLNEPYVVFDNVDFQYDGEPNKVLSNISFTIDKGKTLGILGSVGSGKSTIATLLMRLYETKERGMVRIDGKDIASYPLKALREKISYVPQENILFSDTFSNNIDFMPKKHTEEEIKEAARKAHILETITQYDEKFDQKLGERGVNISGGQKQRLSIARAIMKDADILIMDDCLSAVDTKTEQEIIESLKAEREKRATMIITHRVSSVITADEIIVLDEGRIIERGTHETLIKIEKGLYKRIYERQMLEEKLLEE